MDPTGPLWVIGHLAMKKSSAKIPRKEIVATDIRRRVLTLDYPPGMPLDEVELANQYELSRTPLREVLQRLAGQGYLSAEVNRGVSVASMDLATMRSFFQTAPLIYAAIARLATEQASPSAIAELKRIQQQFKASVAKKDPAEMALQNHHFHAHLGAMAQSPYLAPSLERLQIDHTRMSHRFYRFSHEPSIKRIKLACEQHDTMIDAVERGDPAACVAETIAHWELSRAEIDKYVMPDALPIEQAVTNSSVNSVKSSIKEPVEFNRTVKGA